MRNKNYSSAFLCSILGFVEGVIFSVFTWELFHEQLASIEDNQTYIDDQQKMWGKPQDFLDSCESLLGKDKLWWFVPTHPTLKINYLEQLYSRVQIKQMRRDRKVVEEEEWDINKKFYL